MRLPKILSKMIPAVKSAGKSGWIFAKKHSPEIMVGLGIGGFGLTIYETVRATNKSHDILDSREKMLNEYKWERNLCVERGGNPDYIDEQVAKVKKESRKGLIRAWIPVGTAGAASVIFVLSGFRIINGRYVATVAAYKTLEAGFERYRENVVSEYGEDADWRMMNHVDPEVLEKAKEEQSKNRDIDADNKHRRFRKKKKSTFYADIYNRLFDPHSLRWQRYWTPSQVFEYLGWKEDELNDKLKMQGHLFVNEVYDKLDFERTPEGAITGWIYTKDHPSKVSFGLDSIPEEERRRILATERNEDICVPISLEPDGIIYNLIDLKGLGLKERLKALRQ